MKKKTVGELQILQKTNKKFIWILLWKVAILSIFYEKKLQYKVKNLLMFDIKLQLYELAEGLIEN